MVAVQPTRGLDVGAIATVHRLLLDQRAAGLGDDPDQRGPRRGARRSPTASPSSTRAASSGSFDAADADVAEIGLLMTGGARRRRPRSRPTRTRLVP